ncbi:4Fe-4S dicluster domain-containing protein [Aeromonas caviae]|nr:4Fe-4S dicluster domain-containing protein [Aeromonas caviae]MDX7686671.1 4Fe-4S dicluster domain-containing protein [Aeromonas caviae]MDX7771288.1 4Fe-4S dicluster domain-containing protein [Aeromonas caviae]UTI01771.1 4Fe-4S dicluster domain-containing protein [Aeromonas caviae]
MEPSKRRLLSGIAALTAGAALIPVTQVQAQSVPAPRNGRAAISRGDGRKRYGMLIDLRRCVGCQACTVACTIENQPPLGQFRTTVSQYEVSDVAALEAPASLLMLPRLCNHCAEPACLDVCPTGATFQRDDGIVVVNNDWCVGCGYCVQACPYDARFINHETNTADKCIFCAHRLEAGLLPACVESCVGEARIIGDLNDPKSRIQHRRQVHLLRPSAGGGALARLRGELCRRGAHHRGFERPQEPDKPLAAPTRAGAQGAQARGQYPAAGLLSRHG